MTDESPAAPETDKPIDVTCCACGKAIKFIPYGLMTVCKFVCSDCSVSQLSPAAPADADEWAKDKEACETLKRDHTIWDRYATQVNSPLGRAWGRWPIALARIAELEAALATARRDGFNEGIDKAMKRLETYPCDCATILMELRRVTP